MKTVSLPFWLTVTIIIASSFGAAGFTGLMGVVLANRSAAHTARTERLHELRRAAHAGLIASLHRARWAEGSLFPWLSGLNMDEWSALVRKLQDQLADVMLVSDGSVADLAQKAVSAVQLARMPQAQNLPVGQFEDQYSGPASAALAAYAKAAAAEIQA